jgi:predicted RNA-binding protein YlxR (DUF448 family)
MPRVPVRTCIGCRTACPAAELVCLIAPEGRVRVAQRGPGQAAADEAPGKRGRGAWVHPHCLATALTGGALARAFRGQVEVSDREALLARAHSAHGRSSDAQGDAR